MKRKTETQKEVEKMLETTVVQIAVAQASFYFDRPYS